MLDRVSHLHQSRGRKWREATPQSVHESFDARPGNHTRLSTLIFLRIERTSSELTFREKLITASGFEPTTVGSVDHYFPTVPSPQLVNS